MKKLKNPEPEGDAKPGKTNDISLGQLGQSFIADGFIGACGNPFIAGFYGDELTKSLHYSGLR